MVCWCIYVPEVHKKLETETKKDLIVTYVERILVNKAKRLILSYLQLCCSA